MRESRTVGHWLGSKRRQAIPFRMLSLLPVPYPMGIREAPPQDEEPEAHWWLGDGTQGPVSRPSSTTQSPAKRMPGQEAL